MRSCTSRMMIGGATTRLCIPLMTKNVTRRRERNGSQTDSHMTIVMKGTRGECPPDRRRIYMAHVREAYGHCHRSPHHGNLHSTSYSRNCHRKGVGRLLPPNLAHLHDGVGRLLLSNPDYQYQETGRFIFPSPNHLWRNLVPVKGSNRTTTLLH